jgi:tetratricopeptide (TPR) repeat protein
VVHFFRRTWWAGLAIALAVGLGVIGGHVYHSAAQAAQQLAHARDALDRQQLTTAIDHLQAYVHAVPGSAEGFFLLAQTLRRDGQWDAAEAALTASQRLGYDAQLVRREEALAGLQRRGVRETPTDGLLALAQSADGRPALWEALYRGDLAARNWDRAGLWLHLWLERYPDDWAPRLWQADLLYRFKNYDRSRADYARVLELRPDADAPLLKLGLIGLANRGDYAEAAAYLERYLERDPHNFDAHLGLARCAAARGDLSAARTRLRGILAESPRHAEAALLLGTVESDAGQDDEALRWLRIAEREGADALAVTHQLAQALRRLGRAGEAEPYARRFDELREAHRAVEDAARAVDLHPKSADHAFEVGRLCLVIGDEDRALMWLSSALRLDPGHQATHAALATYYAKQSDPDAAARAELHRRRASSGRQ